MIGEIIGTAVTIIVGVLCIAIGISNIGGNISWVHSYHRKRVSEENRMAFGQMVGTGMIVIGIGIIFAGALLAVALLVESKICEIIALVAMFASIIVGTVIAFRAMIKYNGGIF